MTAPLLDPELLFTYDSHPGACCSCCAGYCPRWEGDTAEPEWIDPRVRMVIDGAEYYGTRIILIRGDALKPLPESFTAGMMEPRPSLAWKVPDHKPPPSKRTHVVRILDILDRAGLTWNDANDQAVHLYAGDEHVGWASYARPGAGCPPEDLPWVRRLAKETGLDLEDAHKALTVARSLPR